MGITIHLPELETIIRKVNIIKETVKNLQIINLPGQLWYDLKAVYQAQGSNWNTVRYDPYKQLKSGSALIMPREKCKPIAIRFLLDLITCIKGEVKKENCSFNSQVFCSYILIILRITGLQQLENLYVNIPQRHFLTSSLKNPRRGVK